MIIFGVRNYYKRDSVYRADVCEQCGVFGQLHSYSSTQAFHVYWIPVFPVGFKRVIDQCQSCKAGREMSLGQWKRLRTGEVLPALDELRVDPGNREVAERALGLVRQFGTPEEFSEAVQLIWPHYTKDADMLARLGWGMSRFHHYDEAGKVLESSLAVEENPEVRQLKEFFDKVPKTQPPKPPSRFGQLVPFLIVPVAVLVVAGIFAFQGLASKPTHVYLANGLSKPYSVKVGGKTIAVPPRSSQKLNVDYGAISVSPVGGEMYPFEFSPISYELKSGFQERSSGGKTVVFNPDRTGVFSVEKIVYFSDKIKVATEEMLNSGSATHYAGKTLYLFPTVNYFFHDPPQNISMSGNRITKTALTMETKLDPAEMAAGLLRNEQLEEALAYARAHLTAEPENDATVLLQTLPLSGDLEEAVRFVEARLDDEPILIEWHRFYQEVKRASDPEGDLTGEYRKRLAERPDSADLTYLTARLLPDGPEQREMFRKSTEMNPPSAFGFFAVAFDYWSRGGFELAAQNIEKARDLRPEEITFEVRERDYLVAYEKWDELESRAKKAFQQAPHEIVNAQELIRFLAANEHESEIRAVVEKNIRAQEAGFDLPPQVEKQVRDVFNAAEAEGKRSPEEYIAAARQIGTPVWRFFADLIEGNVASAAKNLDEAVSEDEKGYIDPLNRLVLYAGAAAKGEDAVAEEARMRFLEELGENAGGLGTWLQDGADPPSFEELVNDDASVDYRHVAAAALAMRFRDKPVSAEFLAYANRMNYRRSFPQMAVDWILREK